ncbi:MAG: cellulase family glycosylhydrolase, partial [Leadbetterella sp.]
MNSKNIFFLFVLSFLMGGYYTSLAQTKGTLKDKNGQIIRGTPMMLGGNNTVMNSTRFTEDLASWNLAKTLHINTVRVCWIDPYYADRPEWGANSTQAQMIAWYDKAVANATATGMNIIINYHNIGEQTRTFSNPTLDMSRLENFWKIIAPRYKDNDLVYYEITNEPIFGQAYGYNTQPFKSKLLNIYKEVRSVAPNRQIIMFSFNECGPGIVDAVNGYKNDLDWNYTSVAYHMYNSTTSEHVRKLMENYRVICTEWDYRFQSFVPNYDYIKMVDGYKENSQA